MSSNYEVFVEKTRTITNCGVQVDDTCEEAISALLETKEQWKEQLVMMTEDLRVQALTAVEAICAHEQEPEWSATDALSQVLCNSSPDALAASQLFDFQAECVKESLGYFFHSTLKFAVSGLSHFDIITFHDASLEEDEKRLENLISHLENKHVQEISALKLKCRELEKQAQILRQELEQTMYQFEALKTRYIEKNKEYEKLLSAFCAQDNKLQDLRRNLDTVTMENARLHSFLPEHHATQGAELESVSHIALGSVKEEFLTPVREGLDEGRCENANFCYVCGKGGSLVLCDRCPNSVHLSCVGRWLCNECETEVMTGHEDKELKLTEEDHDDKCYRCGDGGNLLMCEMCPQCAHPECVNLTVRLRQSVPEKDWFCTRCKPRKKRSGQKRRRELERRRRKRYE